MQLAVKILKHEEENTNMLIFMKSLLSKHHQFIKKVYKKSLEIKVIKVMFLLYTFLFELQSA